MPPAISQLQIYRVWIFISGRLSEWVPFILPALSNLILVFLGVVLSFPSVTDEVEKNRTLFRIVGMVAISFGLIGFVFDVRERHSAAVSNEQLTKSTTALVDNTTKLASSTKTTVDELNLLLPQVKTLNEQFAMYSAKSELARKQGNKRLADYFESQANIAKQQQKLATRQVLLDAAPRLLSQMRSFYEQWNESIRQIPQTGGRRSPEYIQQTHALENTYSEQLRPIFKAASSVGGQLIELLPPDTRNNYCNPQTMGAFQRVNAGLSIENDELERATSCLDRATRAVVMLPPN